MATITRVRRNPDNPLLDTAIAGCDPVGDRGSKECQTAFNDDRGADRCRGEDKPPSISFAGPSLLAAPPWTEGAGDPPIERAYNYYLYFAHHKGGHIRMAYADRLAGPWTVYNPGGGVLRLADIADFGMDHLASPDVHIIDGQVVMYFHSHRLECKGQRTWVATSPDGLNFTPHASSDLGKAYFRVFKYGDVYYAIDTDGDISIAADGPLAPFKPVRRLFDEIAPGSDVRHFAVQVIDDELLLFFSRKDARPEKIEMTTVALTSDVATWAPDGVLHTVLQPRRTYETSNCNTGGTLRRLLDPYVHQEGDEYYLFYCGSDECNISLAGMEIAT